VRTRIRTPVIMIPVVSVIGVLASNLIKKTPHHGTEHDTEPLVVLHAKV